MQGAIDKGLAHQHFTHLAAKRAMNLERLRPRRAEAFDIRLDGHNPTQLRRFAARLSFEWPEIACGVTPNNGID
jgi:hypothetical protein